MRTIYIVCLLSLFSFLSCEEKDREQEQLTTTIKLYTRYLSDEGKIKGEATMIPSPDSNAISEVQQSIPFTEGILFQGKRMRETSLPSGIKYTDEHPADFPEKVEFRFTDLAGNEQLIEIPIKPMRDISFNDKIISKSSDANFLTWEGPPLSKNETCVILISEAAGQTRAVEVPGPTSESRINLPTSQIEELNPGASTVYVVRKGSNHTTAGSNQIQWSYEYYSPGTRTTITY